MSIRVVIADDQDLMRTAVQRLLKGLDGFEGVAEAEDGHAAIRAAHAHKPDVVIMDVSMPGLSGIEATRRVVAECVGVRVLGFSMHADPHIVAGMLSAGALGYVLKDQARKELAPALAAVASGQRYLSSGVSDEAKWDLDQLGAHGSQ